MTGGVFICDCIVLWTLAYMVQQVLLFVVKHSERASAIHFFLALKIGRNTPQSTYVYIFFLFWHDNCLGKYPRMRLKVIAYLHEGWRNTERLLDEIIS
jgi:hypothetical protein